MMRISCEALTAARRSRFWAEGGSWRGPAPRGAFDARAALYAGRSTPGSDPERFLFAGQAVENPVFQTTHGATRFVAVTFTGNWAPLTGIAVDLGGHVLGRSVDGALLPSDPEPRVGTVRPEAVPAFERQVRPRLAVFAGLVVDEFELRASWGNLAGSNRFLPLLDPEVFAPLRAEERRLRVEARWTFWD
jgi:hypothetical protein